MRKEIITIPVFQKGDQKRPEIIAKLSESYHETIYPSFGNNSLQTRCELISLKGFLDVPTNDGIRIRAELNNNTEINI